MDATVSVVSLSILVDVLVVDVVVVLLHAVMVSTRAAAQINDKFLFFIIKNPFKYNLLVFVHLYHLLLCSKPYPRPVLRLCILQPYVPLHDN